MSRAATSIEVAELGAADLGEVVRIDALHTGKAKPEYWRGVFARFVGGGSDTLRVGLGGREAGHLVGYLFGEVRAFEFGSEVCGWIFSIGVEPTALRSGIGSRLLVESCRRFRAAGVARVRTMVVRNEVPVLAFFRSNGFVAGSFVQLEVDLEESR
ncbi:MAG TPA: GNAT family N-acetyltransferase [Acidobacteriota bacterium]